jgi:hypothetical protein
MQASACLLTDAPPDSTAKRVTLDWPQMAHGTRCADATLDLNCHQPTGGVEMHETSQQRHDPIASDRNAANSDEERQRVEASKTQDEPLQSVEGLIEHGSAAAGEADPSKRVYAPASARVPKPPAPGHEALVKHLDDTTPERRAVEQERH